MCSVGQLDPHTLGPGSPQWYASGAVVEIVIEDHNFNVRAHSCGRPPLAGAGKAADRSLKHGCGCHPSLCTEP